MVRLFTSSRIIIQIQPSHEVRPAFKYQGMLCFALFFGLLFFPPFPLQSKKLEATQIFTNWRKNKNVMVWEGIWRCVKMVGIMVVTIGMTSNIGM